MTQRYLRLLTALTLLLTAVQGVAVESQRIPGIKGDDDRELVETANYPWGAIGRLNNTSRIDVPRKIVEWLDINADP